MTRNALRARAGTDSCYLRPVRNRCSIDAIQPVTRRSKRDAVWKPGRRSYVRPASSPADRRYEGTGEVAHKSSASAGGPGDLSGSDEWLLCTKATYGTS